MAQRMSSRHALNSVRAKHLSRYTTHRLFSCIPSGSWDDHQHIVHIEYKNQHCYWSWWSHDGKKIFHRHKMKRSIKFIVICIILSHSTMALRFACILMLGSGIDSKPVRRIILLHIYSSVRCESQPMLYPAFFNGATKGCKN